MGTRAFAAILVLMLAACAAGQSSQVARDEIRPRPERSQDRIMAPPDRGWLP